VDAVVDLIEKNQDESGYFNIYFTVCDPLTLKTAWRRIVWRRHLMEAAVAYYEATGKDKFLKLMCRYADHIERVLKLSRARISARPHEEIELALVRMWHCTGNRGISNQSLFCGHPRYGSMLKKCKTVKANYVQDHCRA
jgi:DUF1680 family protein